MLDILRGILKESFWLFYEMSPWLIIGFFFAGVLHVSFKIETIAKHLGKNSFSSLLKAVILGIPLPLCSCGVIPAGVLLRKSGASKGATISFLIATPITGVDSILATYSLMGGVFAVFRVIASSITAIFAGIIANLAFIKDKREEPKEILEESCPHCNGESSNGNHGVKRGKIYGLLHYAFIKSIEDIWKWLLLGTLIGGAIAFLMPDAFIERYLGSSWISMFVMLIVGLPMYVCSTGSIPIAASLMIKGMSPGAALVFLLAGPATNTVTMAVVSKELGKRAVVIYVGAIAVTSILMGILFNELSAWLGFADFAKHVHSEMLPRWIHQGSTFVLSFFVIFAFIRGGVKAKK